MSRTRDEQHPVTVDSRLAFCGQDVTVRVDTVRLPDGRETTRDTVIYPGAVTVAVLDDRERVLFLRRYRPAAAERLLEMPGGSFPSGQEPELASRRALKRETGLSAQHWDRLGGFFSAPSYLTEAIHVFLAREPSGAGRPPEQDNEATLHWLPLRDLLIDPGAVRDARSLAALQMVAAMLAREAAQPAEDTGCGCHGRPNEG